MGGCIANCWKAAGGLLCDSWKAAWELLEGCLSGEPTKNSIIYFEIASMALGCNWGVAVLQLERHCDAVRLLGVCVGKLHGVLPEMHARQQGSRWKAPGCLLSKAWMLDYLVFFWRLHRKLLEGCREAADRTLWKLLGCCWKLTCLTNIHRVTSFDFEIAGVALGCSCGGAVLQLV